MTQRIERGLPGSMEVTFYGDEAPVDPDGDVRVTVTRSSDGSAAVVDVVATAVSTGRFKTTIPAQPDVDVLTAVWTAEFSGEPATVRTKAEVVGDHWFTVTEARASDPTLGNTDKYPTSMLAETRTEVETEAERIIGAAFVPRFGQVVLHGQGHNELRLPHFHVRRILGVSVDGVAYSPEALADLALHSRVLVCRSGIGFPYGTANVVVSYEHGLDEPPPDLKGAALLRLRHRVNRTKSGIPDRATSFSAAEGGTYSLATPGKGDWETGIPDVDAVYLAYRSRYRADLVSVPIR